VIPDLGYTPGFVSPDTDRRSPPVGKPKELLGVPSDGQHLEFCGTEPG
jgi:hypothetical protein